MECEDALLKFKEKVEAVKRPLEIQNARNAKKAEGQLKKLKIIYFELKLQCLKR